MKIHHLNCGTFCPGFKLPHYGCHCLLLETKNSGLILVDSGFSTEDVANPLHRLGVTTTFLLRAQLKIETTALNQIKKLGFKSKDVRHIVLTHMDPDHMGGIVDFPHAKIHLHREEFDKIHELMEYNVIWHNRIRNVMWEHKPKWELYKTRGEKWQGLEAIQNLKGISEDIYLIPLAGHSPGHCGVAVKNSKKWLLHAGDSYFSQYELSGESRKIPKALKIFLQMSSYNNVLRLENLGRLQALHKKGSVEIFSAHDRGEFLKYHG